MTLNSLGPSRHPCGMPPPAGLCREGTQQHRGVTGWHQLLHGGQDSGGVLRPYFLGEFTHSIPISTETRPISTQQGLRDLPRLRFCFALLFLTLFSTLLNARSAKSFTSVCFVQSAFQTRGGGQQGSEPQMARVSPPAGCWRDVNGQNHGKTAQKRGSSPTAAKPPG